MKFVMFADLHLERQFAWADPPAAARRRHGLRTTLSTIVDLAVAERADAILCGGDLFEDQFCSPDLVNFVASTMDCGIPFLISPGNHDYVSAGSLYVRGRLPQNVHVFDTPVFTAFEVADGLRVWGAAHVAPKGTLGFFDAGVSVDTGGGANFALFHGSERNGFAFEGGDKHPHAPFDAHQIADAGFDYAFVGHHHRAVASTHHCYPGNPDPLEFGEDAGRGAVVADIAADGTVAVTHRDVASTRVHSVTVDVSGCEHGSEVLTLVSAHMASLTGFVRVDLVGELHPDVEIDRHQLADLGRELDGFMARTEGVRRQYQLDEIASEEASVRAAFVRRVQRDDSLTEEDRELIIELGLRSFDNRRDLEVV